MLFITTINNVAEKEKRDEILEKLMRNLLSFVSELCVSEATGKVAIWLAHAPISISTRSHLHMNDVRS